MTKTIAIKKEAIIKDFLKTAKCYKGVRYYSELVTEIDFILTDDDFIEDMRLLRIPYRVIVDSGKLILKGVK